MLVVETGEGTEGADSYFAIETADAYWAARPHDPLSLTWTVAGGPEKEGAAREGCAYLDATWGPLYRGTRSLATQGRLWPRLARVDLDPSAYATIADFLTAQALSDTVLFGADGLQLEPLPKQIVSAAIELAARALTARLAPDKGEDGWLKRRKTGPLEREWGGPGIAGGSFGFIDTLLAPVLLGQRNAQWNWR